MQVHLKFFGRLRETLQSEGESLHLTPAPSAPLVADVLEVLRRRGGNWAEELKDGRALAFAVQQQFVRADAAIKDGDEVAIFPPITGG